MQVGYRTSFPSLDRLDLSVVAVILVLSAAIVGVVWRGDQIGITVQSYGPVNAAKGRASIRVMLDQPVSLNSAVSNFVLMPPVPGKFLVEQNQIIFQPAQSWQPGQLYQVKLRAGLQSSSGRILKQDMQWQFYAAPPRIAYLGPQENIIFNLFLIDPQQTGVDRQLTSSDQGIAGFDVAPDGTIVYAELARKGTTNLYTLDPSTGESRLLYKCPDAGCTNPTFRPDGGALAFEKIDLNSGTNVGPGVTRTWILDLATNTAKPLFKDSQQLGYMPRWSPDGTRLAVVNMNAGGIVIHDLRTDKDAIIPSTQGEVGLFSPDGRWLLFPKVVDLPDHHSVTHMVLVDVSSDFYTQHDLIPDSDPDDDTEAIWLPDSKGVIVARHTPESQGMSAAQLYSVSLTNGAVTPLVLDANYSQNYLMMSPIGDEFLFQRFPLAKPGAHTELWIYNLTTHNLKQVAGGANFARWIP